MRIASSGAVLLIIGCSSSARFMQCRAEEAPALAQIVAAWGQTEKLFFESESLLICYEGSPAEDVLPSILNGHLGCEWKLAYRGEKWLREKRWTQPSREGDAIYLAAEPTTSIVNDRFILDWLQFNQHAFLNDYDMGRNMYSGLEYTLNLALDAPKYIATSNGHAGDLAKIRSSRHYADDTDRPFLPEFLAAHLGNYRVSPDREELDGARVWLVEWDGMDRFWVDPARGFAIPRRAYNWAPGKPLRVEVRNSDYREVKPGLWLPFEQLVEIYGSVVDDPESVWGKVVSRVRYRLKSVEFDSLSDSFFAPKLPVGTVVMDLPRNIKYVVGSDGSDEPFARPIVEGSKQLERTSRWWVALNVAILALVALFLLWRGWATWRAKRGRSRGGTDVL